MLAKKLTTEERNQMPAHMFGLPEERRFPMPDQLHVRLAWQMMNRAKDLTPEQKARLKRNILRRAKELGMDVSDWNISAAANFVVLDAEYPNRTPFLGILCYVDEPSDNPPHISNPRFAGKKVMLPGDVAAEAIDTLKGQGINVAVNFDDHDEQRKIGVIDDAWIDEGFVIVAGHLWEQDFPEEVDFVKSNQQNMGMSYETTKTVLEPLDSEVLVIQAVVFKGATILWKDKAAYTSTALAAKKKGEIEVDEKKLLEILGGFKSELEASFDAKIKPVMDKVAELEAKGNQPPKVELPEEMKTAIEAAGKVGEKVDELTKKLADLEAKGAGKQGNDGGDGQEPQRKTAPVELLAKYGIKAEEGADIVAALDKVDMEPAQRMALKLQLRQTGAIK